MMPPATYANHHAATQDVLQQLICTTLFFSLIETGPTEEVMKHQYIFCSFVAKMSRAIRKTETKTYLIFHICLLGFSLHLLKKKRLLSRNGNIE